jgi:tetratricopeptide (TPR) repeat protein
MRRSLAALLVLASAAGLGRCSRQEPSPATGASTHPPASILLITLDTTRFDAVGPGASGIQTPAFDRLVAKGRRFTQAYATVPETLPSHASMLTGLYPAGHGIHENARFLAPTHPLASERLQQAGYETSAFVSSFVLARRFGLARGFTRYDDELPAGQAERSSKDTSDRAIAYLASAPSRPQFVWVHFFDPHTPYAPPGEFASKYKDTPYLGEVAAMDVQIGRVVEAFETAAARSGTPPAILVLADHGEGLGDHGELQHGNLLYQSTMHVPMVLVAPGLEAGVSEAPVSSRRVFHTLLDLAGLEKEGSLRGEPKEVVLGEAMKPYLSYGWQPQIMAVDGGVKAIFAGRTETYDLRGDPREQKDLGSGSTPAALRKSLDDYPVPTPGASKSSEALSDDARRSLASLGYVSGTATPVVRKDAPRPADMVAMFETIDRASGLFVQGRYAEAIPLLKTIQAKDPYNLDASLRLATSYSMLKQDALALEAFRKAASVAPTSDDVKLYLALHYSRGPNWREAVPTLERIVQEQPERVAALEGLAAVRERDERIVEAVNLRQKVYGLRPATPAELTGLGRMAMEAEQTPVAIESFEKARALQGAAFQHHIELGVLYLDVRRLPEARDALDLVPSTSRDYPMALFKRAQVSVLLNEPDRAQRIERARTHATPLTRALIEREKLFSVR